MTWIREYIQIVPIDKERKIDRETGIIDRDNNRDKYRNHRHREKPETIVID